MAAGCCVQQDKCLLFRTYQSGTSENLTYYKLGNLKIGKQSDLSFKVQFDRIQVLCGPGALCMQVQQVLDGISSLPHRHIGSPQRVCQLGCHHVYTLRHDMAAA